MQGEGGKKKTHSCQIEHQQQNEYELTAAYDALMPMFLLPLWLSEAISIQSGEKPERRGDITRAGCDLNTQLLCKQGIHKQLIPFS